MTHLEIFHDEGQSLWVDGVTRDALVSGVLARSIAGVAVTGATTNLAILQRAIGDGSSYDSAIRRKALEGRPPEDSLRELLLEDAVWAADLFRTIWKRTNGMDGWVSLPVSPLLWEDADGMRAAAMEISDRTSRPNLLVAIPGTDAGLEAVEHAIFSRIPVNVTLLFSESHYLDAADAYLCGLERRVALGLKPQVGSVASLSVPGCPAAPAAVPAQRGPLGVAAGKPTYRAYRSVLRSPRWQRLFRKGARPQRLLWACSGPTERAERELESARALAAPFTINAISPGALKTAFAGGSPCAIPAPGGGVTSGDPFESLGATDAGVDAIAGRLQEDAVGAAVKTWRSLIAAIASKGVVLQRAS